jgi:hypothetical protein
LRCPKELKNPIKVENRLKPELDAHKKRRQKLVSFFCDLLLLRKLLNLERSPRVAGAT